MDNRKSNSEKSGGAGGIKTIRSRRDIRDMRGNFILMIGSERCGPCVDAKNFLKDIIKTKYPSLVVYYAEVYDHSANKFDKHEDGEIAKKVRNVVYTPTFYFCIGGSSKSKSEGFSSDIKSKIEAFAKGKY